LLIAFVFTDAQEVWTWRNPLPKGENLSGIAYGNDTFVAVGNAGTILTSADGQNWEEQITPVTGNRGASLKAVAFGNGFFAAVGIEGTILFSRNGKDWGIQTSGTRIQLNGISFGNGRFVAVGSRGIILSSTDAQNWDLSIVTNASHEYYDVTFGNGNYVAVGRDGVIISSTDGDNWVPQESGTTNWLRGITFGNGSFLAVGENGTIISSGNAVNWAAQGSGTALSLNDVAFNNGTFVAVGGGGTLLSQAVILTSASFQFWEPQDIADVGSLESVTFSNNSFVSIGIRGRIITSPDNTQWTDQLRGPTAWLLGSKYLNNRFYSVGLSGTLLASANGRTWTALDSGISGSLSDLALGNGRFVAIGGSGNVTTSANGVEWTAGNTGTNANLNSIAFGNQIFVAVGNGSIIQTSLNGVDWMTVQAANSPSSLEGVFFGNGRFVAVGRGNLATGSTKRSIMTSTDGINWTEHDHNGNGLNDVTFAKGIFVAVGDNGNVQVSSDGMNWNTFLAGTASYQGVSFGKGLFTAVGAAGTIATSPNGMNWIERNSGTLKVLFDVAFGTDVFVTVGNSGTILTSGEIHLPLCVRASRGQATDRIRVYWQEVSNASRYNVFRNTENDRSNALLIQQDITTPFYDDFTAEAGVVFNYWVKAVNQNETSDFSIVARGYRRIFSNRITSWGKNDNGQTNITPDLSQLTAASSGIGFNLGLNPDGTVTAWGRNDRGQASVPPGLSDVIAVAAGFFHSLALKSDGTVVAWGLNSAGQATPPPDLTGVVAIAGGGVHSLALKSDGSVVAWGNNRVGQMDIPEDLQNVESIATGAIHNLAIKSDGTVVAWGDNRFGQIDVPAGLSDVIAVTAGAQHSLAVKSDGTIIAWGDNSLGQLNVPDIASGSVISTANAKGNISSQFNAGSVTSIASGLFHNIISLADGTVVAWGNDADGQTEIPEALSGVTEVVAGADHNLALLGTGIPLISTVGPGLLELDPGSTAEFTVVVEGQEPLSFQWRKDGQIIEGAASNALNINNVQSTDAGSYTVEISNTIGTAFSSILTLVVDGSSGPKVISQPKSQRVDSDTVVELFVETEGDGSNYSWFMGERGDSSNPISDGGGNTILSTGTQSTLLTSPQSSTNFYWVRITGAEGITDSVTAIVTVKGEITVVPDEVALDGSGTVVGFNIVHSNGNVFDQILLEGPLVTMRADPGQITRASFMDEDDDIVQVEYSGEGTLTIILDADTFEGPAPPRKYNQPDVNYVKGRPRILIDGADESTFFSIFSVGRLNSVNQSLFPEDEVYDAQADVASVEVINASGMGGILCANTNFSASTGNVGLNAPGVPVSVRVLMGDIDALGDAVPLLLFGDNSFTVAAPNPGLRITGGDLVQTNGSSIVIAPSGSTTPGFETLISQNNVKSDGTTQPTQSIDAIFSNADGEEIAVTVEEETIE
jgi:alpha-tubulin suppressor-like RCC1 family protein